MPDIIKTIHAIPLDERIALCLAYKSLDYKWIIRNYLTNCNPEIMKNLKSTDYRIDPYIKSGTSGIKCGKTKMPEGTLFQIANSTFLYYDKWKNSVFAKDVSLKAVSDMCNNRDLMLNVVKQDDTLYFLSRVFNQLTGSTRGLYKCYDCGTNARAMFLKLIQAHRGEKSLFLTIEEQTRMRNEYMANPVGTFDSMEGSSDGIKPNAIVEQCYSMFKNSKQSCVGIMSLGLDNFGHVWVIEKLCREGQPPRYHQYQSCFRSHMVLDFLEYKDYGGKPEQSMDITDFFNKLKYLFAYSGPWTNKEYAIFSELFAFLPVFPIKEGNPSFSFTSITY